MSRLYVDVRNILNLDISVKSPVKTGMLGRYKSVFKGKGLEFDGYRAYSENEDDADMIDWKASARANELLVRQYVEERNMNVFFLIDTGSTMEFSSTSKLKGEYAAEVVLSLAYTILQSGDAVGFCMFSDDSKYKQPFAAGPKQFYLLSNSITDPKNYGGVFNFNRAAEFLFEFAKKGDIVFLVSDFINLKGKWDENIALLAQKYDLIGIMIRDVRDSNLPGKGIVTIEDIATKKQMTVDSSVIKKRYELAAKKQEANVERAFLRMKQGFIRIYTNKSFVEPITGFFNLRGRLWR
mgnify:CR=1 FL=1